MQLDDMKFGFADTDGLPSCLNLSLLILASIWGFYVLAEKFNNSKKSQPLRFPQQFSSKMLKEEFRDF